MKRIISVVLLSLFASLFQGMPAASAAAPDAPTNLVATAGNGTARITFTAPASNGGSTITNYKFSTDDGSTWTSLLAETGNWNDYKWGLNFRAKKDFTLLYIYGLVGGVSYKVKLIAVNADGESLPSAAVTVTPNSSVPSPLGIRSFQNQNSDNGITVKVNPTDYPNPALFNLTAPPDGGSPIDFYEYGFSVSNSSNPNPLPASSVKWTRLPAGNCCSNATLTIPTTTWTPGVVYYIYLRAHNANGYSLYNYVSNTANTYYDEWGSSTNNGYGGYWFNWVARFTGFTSIQSIPEVTATQASPVTAFIPVTGYSSTATTLTYSVSPSLPAGLSFNTSTGEITGTPTVSGSGTYTVTVTNTAGATSSKSFDLAIAPGVDTTLPTVSSFTSSSPDGSYKEGSTINITATLSEPVTSGAQITVTLNTGETVLLSHSATNNTLSGTYTVGAGKTSSDLTVSSYVLGTSANAPTDAAGNIMTSTTVPSGSSNIAGSKAIVIDTTVPTISNVTSSPNSGTLKVGDVVLVRVVFSEAVNVSGTPQLTLETGSTDRAVNYTSGSGTTTLTFSYTVQAGDVSSDLTYVGTTSLVLNGGTIRDIALNDATLTLAAPTSSGSLGANSTIIVDTAAPTAAFTASHPASITSSDTATVTSSEVGTIYLVNNQITVDNLASITGAADSSWNSVSVTSAASSTNLVATGLTPGTYRLYAVDAAGNLSLVSTDSVTVTLAATGTPDLVSSSDLGSSNTDNTTNDDTPEISLSGLTVGAVITLTATPSSGTAVVCTFTATETTGSCSFTTLANGTYSVAATQTFNSVTSSAATLTGLVINKTTIATPSTPDLATASDSAGTSDTDNITSDNTPTINVATSSGTAVVTATKGSSSVSCTISSTSCTLGTLADGVWSLTVTDTDTAGNATTSAALSITVDATKSVASVATLSQTNGTGATVPVQSNELGTAYLVGSGTTYTDPALVVTAAGTYKVTISAINTDTSIATTGLTAGTYKVYVIDAAGNLSLASTNTVTIAAASAPLAVSTTAPSGTSAINSVLTSTSTFSGVPTPSLTYQWVSCIDNTNAANCTNISGATSSTFTPSASALVGTYIRVLTTALNSEGSATSTSSPTTAVAAVAPGAPTLGTVVNGNLQITIPFTPPVSNGGSAITKYQYSLDGTTWLERTDSATVTSPIVIKFTDAGGTTPIVAGTAYTIQVRGVNAVSGGTAATTSAITAATAPGAPTSVSATATGQTTATVSFTAPTSNGGSAITSYTVTSSPGGVSATGSTSPITVSGLTASTAYTFTVTASNAAATSVASTASTSVTTSAPPAPAPVGPSAPAPEPEPVCEAACIAAQVAAAKAAADKVIADRVAAAAKVVAEKIASDTAAKVVAEKVSVDRSAAEAAAKAAVDKAAAAAVAKVAADAAAAQAAVVAKAAADAQAAAVEAASKAAAALKSATTTAAAKATATATAAKAATTAANAVQAAAAAAKAAATAKNTATNASKQVDIAIGALGSQTASASSTAQANAIAAAAKAAANAAAKSAADQAAAAKTASNNANKEATDAAARIVIEQKEAADAAAEAKVAADADLKANELKIAAATESQKAMEAVVAALNEKVVLAEASVKAATVAERAEIDKKIADVSTKIVELQKVADEMQVKADAAIAAQVSTRAAVEAATQNATVQANEASAVKIESIEKTSAATKAAADASLAAKVATAAKAAAAKVPAKAVIAAKPSTSTKPNSTKATISGLKPGQKVKVTVNVKGK
jgi:Bacterial Ig-like domain/Fibronectin type III domain